MENFEAWWNHEAIFIDQFIFEDDMEFTKRLCEMAWATGVNAERDACAQLADAIGDVVTDLWEPLQVSETIAEQIKSRGG